MRTPRSAALLVLGLVAGLALTGCRTSPDVAAYVGDETITVAELEGAVESRRADPAVTAGEDPDYTRAILSGLVRAEVFDSAAEHFGIDPHPGGLPELLEALLDGQDPDAFVEQAAAQGYSRADVLEQTRQIALLGAIAVAQGEAEEPTEESLRAAYDRDVAGRPTEVDLGFIVVPDQATADATVAALQDDPGSYATIAASYPDQSTLPEPQTAAFDRLEAQQPELAAQIAATPAGGAFSTTVPGVSGVLVVLVLDATVPSFEEVRPRLEAAALEQAVSPGTEILAQYQEGLDIDVNPRYGVLDEGSVVEPEGGVVQVLGRED